MLMAPTLCFIDLNFDTPPFFHKSEVGISGLSVSVTHLVSSQKVYWEECLLACRGGYIAVGGVEYQLCSFREGAAEGEVNFYGLHSAVFKLEIAFEVYAVDIHCLYKLRTDYEVYAVDSLRGVWYPYHAKRYADPVVGFHCFVGDDVDFRI